MTHIFIVNPYAGQQNHAEKLRAKLAEYSNLKYFVFTTRYAGYEKEVVKKIQHIFEGEKLRFYCCGGSGTMRNMLNGIEDLQKVEVAFLPCGLTNDFLKTFPGGEKSFSNLDDLIYGKVINVDYFQTNHGIALNTVSLGVDYQFLEKIEEYRIFSVFGKKVPYMFAVFAALFFPQAQDMNLICDGEEYEDSFTEIIYANGNILGGILHIDNCESIHDGNGEYILVRKCNSLTQLRVYYDMIKEKYDHLYQKNTFGNSQAMTMKRCDGTPFDVNMDGERVHIPDYLKIQMIKEGLHLVVPRRVRL